MALAIKRFDFDGLQDFQSPPPIEIATSHTLPEAEEFTPPPPPSFSQEELDAAKQVAFEDGRAAGAADAAAQQAQEAKAREEATLKALEKIGSEVLAMQQNFTAFKAKQTEEIGELVKLLVGKIAGDALRQWPQQSVQQLIDECLGVLQTEPRIIAKVHPDVFEPVEARLRDIAERYHLENTITLKASPELAPSEAVLNWGDGMAERNMADIWEQIEGMIATINFAQLAEMPAAQPSEQPKQGESNE